MVKYILHTRCMQKDDFYCLKVDMPIQTCIFFTFNWLTLTSEMHFVKFHPEVASCLLSRGKRKYTVRPLFKKFTQHCETYEPTNCCVKKNTQLV